jgi:hypothetical protein
VRTVAYKAIVFLELIPGEYAARCDSHRVLRLNSKIK